ncbi:Rab5 GDP/GTP exchange factor [Bagarius yarrelli]|uniref:General transcription factor IIH subunit 3 n=1 Tax=Bagarius yarrelli TaxID=175774 RepID=A0A556V6L5_BAGYA|nr:Rab5 GDP/GTP exchange factor [Bagarius yarrelli]
MANAHLVMTRTNKLAIIASHCQENRFLYPNKLWKAEEAAGDHVGVSAGGDGKYELLSVADDIIAEEIRNLMAKNIHRVSKELEAGQDMKSRILVIKAAEDCALQYMNFMNVIFAAQKQNILIDACVLDSDSGLLQQACDITGGLYLKIPQKTALTQYLLWVFLPDADQRSQLVLPPPVHVDYRAACFCHRNLIEIGYVCSVCLSSNGVNLRRMWAEQRRGIHVTQDELLCKDGCGFYGNSAWQGYCSKCWRKRKTSKEDHGVHEDSRSQLSKTEEKKNVEKGRRSSAIMRLLWGSSSPPQQGKSPEAEKSSLKFFQNLEPGDFPGFLKLLRNPSSHHLQSRCTAFLNTIEAYHDLPVQKQSDLVQDFYQTIAAYFDGLPELQVSQMMEHIEKLIMTRLHKWVFCHDSCDDEQKDLTLQRRIKSLNWVTPEMLHVPFPKGGSDTSDPYLPAITAIIEMDAKRAPQDKLACLFKCSQHVFQALAVENRQPANADDFLSVLIYVVLRANPPRLHSNINYIVRFGLPHSLMAGESGYYFTNLSCAVAFIEKLDGPSLNLTSEEFNAYMQGRRAPPTLAECSGQQRAQENREQLEKLKNRQEKVEQGVRALQEQLDSWVRSVQDQIDDVKAQTVLVLKEDGAEAQPGETVC